MRNQKKKRLRTRRVGRRQPMVSANGQLDVVGIVDRYKDAVVNIEVAQAKSQSPQALPFPFNLPMFNTPDLQPRAVNIGTGFIFDKRGYILTNEHVIHGASQVHVKLFGKKKVIPASVVGTHYHHDLAVIKVTLPHEVPILQLGDSSDVKVGEWVIAIGNPNVQFATKTEGLAWRCLGTTRPFVCARTLYCWAGLSGMRRLIARGGCCS